MNHHGLDGFVMNMVVIFIYLFYIYYTFVYDDARNDNEFMMLVKQYFLSEPYYMLAFPAIFWTSTVYIFVLYVGGIFAKTYSLDSINIMSGYDKYSNCQLYDENKKYYIDKSPTPLIVDIPIEVVTKMKYDRKIK